MLIHDNFNMVLKYEQQNFKGNKRNNRIKVTSKPIEEEIFNEKQRNEKKVLNNF